MHEKNGPVPEKVVGTAKGSYSGNAPIVFGATKNTNQTRNLGVIMDSDLMSY